MQALTPIWDACVAVRSSFQSEAGTTSCCPLNINLPCTVSSSSALQPCWWGLAYLEWLWLWQGPLVNHHLLPHGQWRTAASFAGIFLELTGSQRACASTSIGQKECWTWLGRTCYHPVWHARNLSSMVYLLWSEEGSVFSGLLGLSPSGPNTTSVFVLLPQGNWPIELVLLQERLCQTLQLWLETGTRQGGCCMGLPVVLILMWYSLSSCPTSSEKTSGNCFMRLSFDMPLRLSSTE